MNQGFPLRINLSWPVGDVSSLNGPSVYFPIINCSLLSQQIHILSSAVHTCNIKGSVSQVGGSVEDRVVLLECWQIQRKVWWIMRAHMGQSRSSGSINLGVQLIFEQQEGHKASISILFLEIDMSNSIFKTLLSLERISLMFPVAVDVRQADLVVLFLSDHVTKCLIIKSFTNIIKCNRIRTAC